MLIASGIQLNLSHCSKWFRLVDSIAKTFWEDLQKPFNEHPLSNTFQKCTQFPKNPSEIYVHFCPVTAARFGRWYFWSFKDPIFLTIGSEKEPNRLILHTRIWIHPQFHMSWFRCSTSKDLRKLPDHDLLKKLFFHGTVQANYFVSTPIFWYW